MSSQLCQLANDVVRRAASCGLTIVTAESCTAGKLAAAFAEAEGASKQFHGGVIAYTKAMKAAALGVPMALLEEKTAVCAEVASAMAKGALKASPADVAVAITGVAGPEPDEDGNPVGLVYCAAARRDGTTRELRLDLAARDPDAILEEAMRCAFTLVGELCRIDA